LGFRHFQIWIAIFFCRKSLKTVSSRTPWATAISEIVSAPSRNASRIFRVVSSDKFSRAWHGPRASRTQAEIRQWRKWTLDAIRDVGQPRAARDKISFRWSAVTRRSAALRGGSRCAISRLNSERTKLAGPNFFRRTFRTVETLETLATAKNAHAIASGKLRRGSFRAYDPEPGIYAFPLP
jgi:hypothetical protein